MMRSIAAIVATIWATGVSAASDKPLIAPAPAWVRPVTVPNSSLLHSDLPVRLMLSDQQVLLQPKVQARYFRFVMRIETPQGLSAGNVSLPWRPDLDVLTVHNVEVRRGATTIDVLAKQAFTVVRREQNLDASVIDGILTANIQPEGLQVGDIIDVSGTMTTRDPALQDHVEQISALANDAPVDRIHLRVQWPAALQLHVREAGGKQIGKPVREGNLMSVEATLDETKPVLPPKGAPVRFRYGHSIEFSDAATWPAVARLIAPLFDKAAAASPNAELAAEIARIKAMSTVPERRAEAALALVQDKVRYVALFINDGGLVPVDAETTWRRRYGDCKGKTVLLITLLRALGIDAVPVLVSTVIGDGLDERLPAAGLFNHVLVRATIGSRDYWLDGTRPGGLALDAIPTPYFRWGLPLVANGSALVAIVPAPPSQPLFESAIRIDASQGLSLPAPFHVETLLRGDLGLGYHVALVNLADQVRDQALRAYFKGRFDFVTIKSVAAEYDGSSGTQRLMMDGDAAMDWSSGWYELDGVGVGYKADFARDAGIGQDAPYALDYPAFNRNVEIITLPAGFEVEDIWKDIAVKETVAGIAYQRAATLAGNIFTVQQTDRALIPELSAIAAPAAQKRLRELAGRAAYLKKPQNYHWTDAEVTKALTTQPDTASALVERGYALYEKRRFKEAIRDFDAAIVKDPKNAWAFADRALAYISNDNMAQAIQDANAALALDPKNFAAFNGRALVAEHAGKFDDAIRAYTQSLENNPGDDYALAARAAAYLALGNVQKALDDTDAVIAKHPANIDAYLTKANLLKTLAKPEDAVGVANAVVRANPTVAYAQVVAGKIYNAFGRQAEALSAFNAAISIKPEPYIYINRAEVRPPDDYVARLADIDAALALQPTNIDAISAKARVLSEAGKNDDAVTLWTQAMAAQPDKVWLRHNRGLALAKAGKTVLADADFAAVRAKTTDRWELNNYCYEKGLANVALLAALEECDTALKSRADEPAILDSRGFVLLRLLNFDAAIADFDRALAKNPTIPSSLFGRALAWNGKGERTRANVDFAAALKLDPNIESRFGKVGLSR